MPVTEKDKQFWHFQYHLASAYLVPLFHDWGIHVSDSRILDIGCAEGGVISALAELDAECVGVDISAARVSIARQLVPEGSAGRIRWIVADALSLPFRIPLSHEFDLILFRDIFYQLPNKSRVLRNIQALMTAKTRLFISLPAFYSIHTNPGTAPNSWLRFFPILHILPDTFWKLARPFLAKHLCDSGAMAKLDKLRKHRISIAQFMKSLKAHGLEIKAQRYYLSRPSHRLSYGFPVILTNHIGRIPVLREIFVTGVFYLLAKQTR